MKERQCFFELQVETFYKRFAIEICINLIANALARCEFQTFDKGKETRRTLHYMLNVQPNQNQNATQFFHEAIKELLFEGECLIINDNGKQFLIAESFERVEFAFKPNIYKNIIIRGYELKGIYEEKDVFYLKLTNERITKVIDDLYSSYGKLLASSMNYYRRKNNKRLLIKSDFLREQDEDTQKEIDEMFDKQLANWFNPDIEAASFDLQEGYEMEDMSDSKGGAQGGLSDSKDIRELIDGIINYTATAFQIPRGMLKGDLAEIEAQIDSFIMFALGAPAEMIADEFNRKLYTVQDHTERTYLKMDTTKIKVTDISKLATAADKLFSMAAIDANTVMEMLGGNPVDADWARARYVTKNYERVDITEKNLKGGEN